MERVIAYVDGFNLYHGLKERGLRKFYWLNIQSLVENILKPDQTLVRVNYFTSRVSNPPAKVKRQGAFIEALQTLPKVKIYFGHYVPSKTTCRACGNVSTAPREKRTDVNIAAVMLHDAYRKHMENAILISADTDLIGPLNVIKQIHPGIKRTIAFPPGRFSDHLKREASGWFHIGEDKFAKSLFPQRVINKSGYALEKPALWG